MPRVGMRDSVTVGSKQGHVHLIQPEDLSRTTAIVYSLSNILPRLLRMEGTRYTRPW